ncbi:MAG: type I-U CRISPR-associated protein Cas7, partial [Prosthecobacter sp.]|nr:type I-U CRISPR-associated protein Cas7 [Prosthecobacter sp.]
VVTTLSEGHRLASSYFLDDKSKVVEDDKVSEKNFGTVLREGFGIRDLGKKTHPLPGDWWNVFRTIFRYDPNSLVHGILFPAMGIKLSRVLTAHHEAFGADRVGLSGVKFDKLGKTTSGQPIFSVDKETAREIRATFVIDLSLIRSFGRGANGLNDNQKQFLLELALWKIGRLLSSPYKFRSGCDLKCSKLVQVGGKEEDDLSPEKLGAALKDLIAKGDSLWQEKNEKGELAAVQKEKRVTQVYWPSEELFKAGKGDDKDPEAADDSASTDEDNFTSLKVFGSIFFGRRGVWNGWQTRGGHGVAGCSRSRPRARAAWQTASAAAR